MLAEDYSDRWTPISDEIIDQSIQHLVEIIRGIEHLASDRHAETGLIAQKFRFQDGTGIEVNNSHAFLQSA